MSLTITDSDNFLKCLLNLLVNMELKKISENEWEIPKSGGMKVPARIFASDKLIAKIKQDRTLMQAANVAHLQGIQKFSFVMPDAHEGY